MELKLIDSNTTPHAGYGAGSGEVIKEEYQCPCGHAKVIYEKDAIPGFRDSDIWCTCKECNDKYEFRRGVAYER
ncbi:hypothetical protein BC6307_21090 [Sutcliffiella cohnii]|uniref:Uncharacterized protein n=1 Tax=Sutcliffiella cohnii TaxID=33932 RepID=A0A223KW43_9BACI|nr:hypothetical protein [Sutcliffiella cohnii]AST93584.1 hypothetical protein BC6307_21090 [Sutcliffiella cohnii]